MSDRAQIIMERAETRIHLYTHWRGSQVPGILATALQRGKERWYDESYLTRIIFCTLCPDEEHSDLTGFGISTQYQDSTEYTDLIVDMDHMTVHYRSSHWTFNEYIKLSPVTWKDLE